MASPGAESAYWRAPLAAGAFGLAPAPSPAGLIPQPSALPLARGAEPDSVQTCLADTHVPGIARDDPDTREFFEPLTQANVTRYDAARAVYNKVVSRYPCAPAALHAPGSHLAPLLGSISCHQGALARLCTQPCLHSGGAGHGMQCLPASPTGVCWATLHLVHFHGAQLLPSARSDTRGCSAQAGRGLSDERGAAAAGHAVRPQVQHRRCPARQRSLVRWCAAAWHCARRVAFPPLPPHPPLRGWAHRSPPRARSQASACRTARLWWT